MSVVRFRPGPPYKKRKSNSTILCAKIIAVRGRSTQATLTVLGHNYKSKNMQTEPSVNDEISLMDIYEFLAGEWKFILAITFLGTSIGVVTSLNVPDQFEAQGLIQGARVAVMHSTNSLDVESSATLAEKMRSPSYYDSKTVAACVGEDETGNSEIIAKALNANVVGNSNFVSVVYRAKSKDRALKCLEQVLMVVVEDHKKLAEAHLTSLISSLDNAKKTADELRKTSKLLESEASAEIKNVEHSLSALLLLDMHQLKTQELFAVDNEIYRIESMLKVPNTQDAKFLTPVHVSEQRVSPRRGQIVMISSMAGLFFGVLMAFVRRAFVSIKKQRGERLKSASIT